MMLSYVISKTLFWDWEREKQNYSDNLIQLREKRSNQIKKAIFSDCLSIYICVVVALYIIALCNCPGFRTILEMSKNVK